MEQQAGIDLRETGASLNGAPQKSEQRLFIQLQVFGGCPDPAPLIPLLEASGLEGVLYRDLNDPQGIGLLILAEHPEVFVQEARALLAAGVFASLERRAPLTMTGRSYSTGREADLTDWLLHKPRRTALNPEWPWAIWYPLRRTGAFSALPHEEQMRVLKEHGNIGRAFGDAGHVQDIRLASYGLDRGDNDFVIGLIGRELYPLSAVVQAMRKTRQTSEFIRSMGPFFVGRALWQSPAP